MTFSMGADQNLRGQLVTALSRFLNGVSTLDSLQDWLLSHLQAILDSDDALVIQAADDLDAALMQLGEQLLDEATLLSRVKSWEACLQTISVDVSDRQEAAHVALATDSSISATIFSKLEYPPPTLRPSLEFGGRRSAECTQLS